MSGPDLYVLTVVFLALKKTGFSGKKNPLGQHISSTDDQEWFSGSTIKLQAVDRSTIQLWIILAKGHSK